MIRAKTLLWRLLGNAIDLPFNAYDHRAKLAFTDVEGAGEFTFDLAGVLKRRDQNRLAGEAAVEVFVEVKAVKSGDSLLAEYREFLRHAAIVSLERQHADTWFIFLSEAPFGSSYGAQLCDGSIIYECGQKWSSHVQKSGQTLTGRVALLIATKSFQHLLEKWGAV